MITACSVAKLFSSVAGYVINCRYLLIFTVRKASC